MKLEWDYTELAAEYSKRPPYAQQLLRGLFRRIGGHPEMRVCDIGAGTGNLTIPLAEEGFRVAAIEPNYAMRAIGEERTSAYPRVTWYPSVAECTGLPASHFDLVAFASSFNVVRREEALRETWRILRVHGWFTCLWNFRDLSDPLQQEIEDVIHSFLPGYRYGTRREDQRPLIEGSGLFGPTEAFERNHIQTISRSDWLTAWKSHATLRRQAGDRFLSVLKAIEALLARQTDGPLRVPYVTRAWLAQKRE